MRWNKPRSPGRCSVVLVGLLTASATAALDAAASNLPLPWREGFEERPADSVVDDGTCGTGAHELIEGYQWLPSASGSHEYYLQASDGGNPGIDQPSHVGNGNARFEAGMAGQLQDHQWSFADNDGLGYETIYFADASGNPDTSGVTLFAGFYENGAISARNKNVCGGSEFSFHVRDRSYETPWGTIEPRVGDKYFAIEGSYTDWESRASTYKATALVQGHFDGGRCASMAINGTTEYWMAFSHYIPEDQIQEARRSAIMQVATTGPEPGPQDDARTIIIGYGGGYENDDDFFSLRHEVVYQEENHWWNSSAPPVEKEWMDFRGQWVDWVIQATWHDSDDPNANLVVYMNGEPVMERPGLRNLPNATGPQWGLFVYSPGSYSCTHVADSDCLGAGDPHSCCTASGEGSCNENCYYGTGTTPALRQCEQPHVRAAYFDELRFIEDEEGGEDYSYCHVCPAIPPDTPVIILPADGASGLDGDVELQFSAATESRDDPQECFSPSDTQVQVDLLGGDWSGPVYDTVESGSAVDRHWIEGLADPGQYQVRVRHGSMRAGTDERSWGRWSEVCAFSVGQGGGGAGAGAGGAAGVDGAGLVPPGEEAEGCSCSAPQQSPVSGLGVGILGTVGLWLRRRMRSHRGSPGGRGRGSSVSSRGVATATSSR